MNTISAIKLNATTTSLHVQRAALAPTNRDLSLLLQSKFGREPDSFKAKELQLARVVFAQVALMAGAALVADTETFVGAEQLWRDMQDSIGAQERALAKHFLDLLSRDEYYSETERRLISALGKAVVDSEEPRVTLADLDLQPAWVARLCGRELPAAVAAGAVASASRAADAAVSLAPEEATAPAKLDGARISVTLDDALFAVACDQATASVGSQDRGAAAARGSAALALANASAASPIWLEDAATPLQVLRAALAPSNRELALMLDAEYGRGLESFQANELAIARVVFAQVALMAGAALAADTETYAGAEQLWRDMLQGIGARERAMAKHFLELLSRDEYYQESERKLIGALAEALLEGEGLREAFADPKHPDRIAAGIN